MEDDAINAAAIEWWGTTDQHQDAIDGFVAGWHAAATTTERLTDALQRIEDWSHAYPLPAFPEPDLDRARAVLEAAGLSLDAVSADAMRHVITQVAKIARDALEGTTPPVVATGWAVQRYGYITVDVGPEATEATAWLAEIGSDHPLEIREAKARGARAFRVRVVEESVT